MTVSPLDHAQRASAYASIYLERTFNRSLLATGEEQVVENPNPEAFEPTYEPVRTLPAAAARDAMVVKALISKGAPIEGLPEIRKHFVTAHEKLQTARDFLEKLPQQDVHPVILRTVEEGLRGVGECVLALEARSPR